MPHIIVGTAGHIDHGKTALVKALTGIDADRLKEEKARGITIDIGFANLTLDAGTTLGFVDVPGHERFIKNMLAGVGGIDVVMLVVAADESVMPQTREHLDICSLLRIPHGLTVLTKIDATDPELVDIAEMEVLELARGTFLEGAPVLRVSSATGEGLAPLVECLGELARRTTPKDASRVFRLPIDRAFTMKGFGTVVSGTLISGRVQREQEVEILPVRRIGRVRGIQVHGAVVEEARAGQRTALNLQRLDLGDVQRGMVAAPAGVFTPGTVLDVALELLPSAPPIVRRKRIRFHAGTAELIGQIALTGQERLEPGGTAVARIRLEGPTFVLPGDRFIIRQYSPMLTIGGGEILDAHPRRHRRAGPAARERLDRLSRGSLDDRLLGIVEDAGLQTVSVQDVVARLGLLPAEAAARLHTLAAEGDVLLIGEPPITAVAADVFTKATADLTAEVRRFHEREPLMIGISREDLKGRVLRRAPGVLFRAALDRLVAEQRISLHQDVVQLFERTVVLEGADTRARDLLLERYRALGLEAPPADDVSASVGIERQTARKIVHLLLKEGALVRISEGLVMDRQAIDMLIAQVQDLKTRTTRLGVGEFKRLTGLSRKFAMPLLEYLDGRKITRRVGEEREIL